MVYEQFYYWLLSCKCLWNCWMNRNLININFFLKLPSKQDNYPFCYKCLTDNFLLVSNIINYYCVQHSIQNHRILFSIPQSFTEVKMAACYLSLLYPLQSLILCICMHTCTHIPAPPRPPTHTLTCNLPTIFTEI